MKIVALIVNVTVMLTLIILPNISSLTSFSYNKAKVFKKKVITNKFMNDSRSNFILQNSEKEKDFKNTEFDQSSKKLITKSQKIEKKNQMNESNDQIEFLEKSETLNTANFQNNNQNLYQMEEINQNPKSFLSSDMIKSMFANDKSVKNVSFNLKDNTNSIINENLNELKKMKIFDKYKLTLNPPKELDLLNSIKSIDKDIVLKGLDFAKKISHEIEEKRQLRTGNKCVCPENVIFCDCDEILINHISENKPEISQGQGQVIKRDKKYYLNNVKTTCIKKDQCNGSNNCSCKCNCLWETNDGKECIFNLLDYDFSDTYCDCPCLQNINNGNLGDSNRNNITKDYVLDFLRNTDISSNKSIDKINKMNQIIENQKNIAYRNINEYNKSLEIENENGENIDKIYTDMYAKGLEAIRIN